jgi:hypothetical protein
MTTAINGESRAWACNIARDVNTDNRASLGARLCVVFHRQSSAYAKMSPNLRLRREIVVGWKPEG